MDILRIHWLPCQYLAILCEIMALRLALTSRPTLHNLLHPLQSLTCLPLNPAAASQISSTYRHPFPPSIFLHRPDHKKTGMK